MRNLLLVTLILLLSSTIFAQFEVELELITSGLSSPTKITNAGDDRLFVCERSGRIRIIDGNGNLLSTPFLDIDPIVHNASGQSEQGLLGLAFHPEYPDTPYFYVNYTDNNDDTQIARYEVSASDPNVAEPDSGKILMDIFQPFSNHNGGEIVFGDDGYLYIGMGDGGSANDPMNLAQNTNSLLGKMLRIDVDNGDPYAIPDNNPFVDDPDVLDEIWAIGYRNPWRFSKDHLTGDFWIGDVGQGTWEEIDYEPATSPGGLNYGWRCYEGNHPFITGGCAPAGEYAPAYFEYNHQGFTHCSVTGGYVYRGAEFPDMYGWYFYADYCSGKMWALTEVGPSIVNIEAGDFSGKNFSSFGEDNQQNLYVAAIDEGRVYKINSIPCATFSADVVTTPSCLNDSSGTATFTVNSGTPPYTFTLTPFFPDISMLPPGDYTLTVTDMMLCETTTSFTIDAYSYPGLIVSMNEDTLTVSGCCSYQWYVDGAPIAGATDSFYVFSGEGSYYAEVTTDEGCLLTSPVVVISSDRHPPEIHDLDIFPNPASDQLYISKNPILHGDVAVSLIDLQGRVLYQQFMDAQKLMGEGVSIQMLPAGFYTLEIQAQQKRFIGKVVVQ